MEQWEIVGKTLNLIYTALERPTMPCRQATATCGECGTVYESEDGDGGCPRCGEYAEIVGGVLSVLRDARCSHLPDQEIREAVAEATGKFVIERYQARKKKR